MTKILKKNPVLWHKNFFWEGFPRFTRIFRLIQNSKIFYEPHSRFFDKHKFKTLILYFRLIAYIIISFGITIKRLHNTIVFYLIHTLFSPRIQSGSVIIAFIRVNYSIDQFSSSFRWRFVVWSWMPTKMSLKKKWISSI